MLVWFIVFILLCIFIAIISSIADNNRFIVSDHELTSDKIKKDCTIAFLSDLHSNSFGKGNIKLIEAVKASKPDIIIMGGDMVTSISGETEEKRMDIAVNLTKALSDYRIYYGIGNHEYRMFLYREDFEDNFDILMRRLKENGVHVLRNEKEHIDEFNIDIQGLEIERRYYKRGIKVIMEDDYLTSLIDKPDPESYKILMAHNPEFFEQYAKVADLVLSGHFHGGIVRLPFVGGVISSRLSLFPKYDGGRYDEYGAAMIVSKGLGSHTIPLRVFNPCELCVIKLKKI